MWTSGKRKYYLLHAKDVFGIFQCILISPSATKKNGLFTQHLKGLCLLFSPIQPTCYCLSIPFPQNTLLSSALKKSSRFKTFFYYLLSWLIMFKGSTKINFIYAFPANDFYAAAKPKRIRRRGRMKVEPLIPIFSLLASCIPCSPKHTIFPFTHLTLVLAWLPILSALSHLPLLGSRLLNGSFKHLTCYRTSVVSYWQT